MQETSAGHYTDVFARRHIGPSEAEIAEMLTELGYKDIDSFVADVVPSQIRTKNKLKLKGLSDGAMSEFEALADLRALANQNKVFKSYIGQGYSDTIVPPVVQRGVLENPGWYTQYTPYQAEIAQGRLEALLNFQTLISDLTGLPISNASLLDEGTAAAEAMSMAHVLCGDETKNVFFVSDRCHPQTLEVLGTRATPLGIKLVIGDHKNFEMSDKVFGALVQYPTTDGAIVDYKSFGEKVHSGKALFVVAADLMSLCLLKAPAEFGADIAVGSAQRFGVPLGYGGPHAAYLSTKDEYKRQIPGRLVGVSIDAQGKTALRLALQTREQHIRRAKATSNICTAQVLLAVMASMYAVYHGPKGLRAIAQRVHDLSSMFAEGVKKLGFEITSPEFFDTICVNVGPQASDILKAAAAVKINLRRLDATHLCVSFDEVKTYGDVNELLKIFNDARGGQKSTVALGSAASHLPQGLLRKSAYLTHPVFNSYHSETEMLRYMTRLQSKDLSLNTSMIPLGSCTMKLNAAAEMFPVTWPEFGKIHPFVPADQAQGYKLMIERLESWLCEITGFDGVSLQPNAGSQGEYAGLLVIRAYHLARGDKQRDVCLIPTSAHGTNPASAVMANMKVVPVECDAQGNISLTDLKAKATEHSKNLAALMVTYPSTHGVFEEEIREICEVIHKNGGQVYMDGANMNAQVGLCRPGEYGPDVCHLNLHKTFCIPHGGGGPGMGPIAVKQHLKEFLPGHSVVKMGGSTSAVSAAPWGSASILPISYAYIAMMGADGLTDATKVAILNANYMAKKLSKSFPVLFTGRKGLVAHECIIDLRGLKSKGIEVVDVAKRLMDYGFHAPTVSWPVAGTVMIEPTESESKAELDRFCKAMEMISVEVDECPAVLKNAPHTAQTLTQMDWKFSYSREKAVFPASWLKVYKFWPSVSRINDPHGDRNLICSCPPMESYS